MNRYLGLILLLSLTGFQQIWAEEGMWIPMLIEKYHMEGLKEAGLRLEAEEIYSINQACLKDAVIIFGTGCTGEVISNEGLILTNHHCGEGAIQAHSSVQNDILSNGFWAMSREEELANEALSVTFLRYMQDVTEKVNEGLSQGMDPLEKRRKLELNTGEIIREATTGTHYNAEVKPFFHENAYYLFVYEMFTDVRLVGAPPSSIGNFGGDLDNWIWPRHTGDFTLFRVYAGENNEPADYSPSNRPYRPRRHLEISTRGVQEGDFTMMLGYPASTSQYLYSGALSTLLETSLPLKIELRSSRLQVMEKYMGKSEVVRIQYAHKYRRVSNAWKKWQGVILGLKRNHAVERKKEQEDAFMEWVYEDDLRRMKYDHLPEGFAHLHGEMKQFAVAIDLMDEAIAPLELLTQADRVRSMMQLGLPREVIENQVNRFFKDVYMPVDRDIFDSMMRIYHERMPTGLHPGFFNEIQKRHKGNFSIYAESVYGKSIFGAKERVIKLLDTYEKSPGKAIEKLRKDPISVCLAQIREIYFISVNPPYAGLKEEEDRLYKTYMAGLMEMSDHRQLYPDANRTMRLSYGKVEGYRPRDGVQFKYTTSLSGLLEKARQDHNDYSIPAKLAALYESRDYGAYGVKGTMPVCFIATNHSSGGNSGSPVLDAEGRLIGINFDRVWEGTMSDYYFDPSLCRNIAVDIRYVLFIIDKFAGAGYLLDELDIVW